MAEKYELAYEDYKAKMKLKDIAEKYGVSINTVKTWQQRKWKQMLQEEKEKLLQPDFEAPKQNRKTYAKKTYEETSNRPDIEYVVDEFEKTTENNATLTDNQRLFCLYYTKYHNITKAYQRVYGCSYASAGAAGPKLFKDERIQKEIKRLKRARVVGVMLDKDDILQMYIDIAFADLGDYLEYGNEVIVMTDEAGVPLLDEKGERRTYTRSFVTLKNGVDLDNSIVSEVKQGKDGISFKLHDKMRALDALAKYTDLFDEKMNNKVKLEKLKTEKAIKDIELKGLQDNKDDNDIKITFVKRGGE